MGEALKLLVVPGLGKAENPESTLLTLVLMVSGLVLAILDRRAT